MSRGLLKSNRATRIEVRSQLAHPVPRSAPTLGTQLRAWLESRIGAVELRRRLWHILPGFLGFASWTYPHEDPLSPTFKAIAIGLIVGVSISLLRKFHTIVRTEQESGISATAGYAFSVLLTILLFPAHAELGMAVLGVLAFGDGCATLGGLLFGRRPLPWNRDKTWAGFVSFLVAGVPMATVLYWGESQPLADWSTAFICGTTAACLGAIAESLPSRINDNIRVGIAAVLGVVSAHALTVGL